MDNGNITRRKSNLARNLIIIAVGIVCVIVLSYFLFSTVSVKRSSSANTGTILKAWKKYDYKSVYELSQHILDVNPFNNFALTYHGVACFYLAVSSLDSSDGQMFLDDAINSIRIALIYAKKSAVPQLEYMLGKCYFYKNTVSTYYYSDLAEKYLVASKEHGYKADDISEYLGLCYAALGMPQKSIQCFTESLLVSLIPFCFQLRSSIIN